MRSEVKYDLSKLDTFVKQLSSKYAVHVGIFGNKSARRKGQETNASVGALHEFGSVERHIPPRSFLRMPLAIKGAQIVKEASEPAVKALVKGDVVFALKCLGIACENAIQHAFATRGFGTWKPNAPSTIKRKQSDAPLIDTGQLRRAISSKVVKL